MRQAHSWTVAGVGVALLVAIPFAITARERGPAQHHALAAAIEEPSGTPEAHMPPVAPIVSNRASPGGMVAPIVAPRLAVEQKIVETAERAPSVFDGVSKEALPDHMEAYFQEDRYDPRWARATSFDLSKKLATTSVANARVESVDCRSTVCRVRMTFGDRDAQREYFKKVLFGPAMTMAGYAHVKESGSGVGAEAYFFDGAMP